MGLEALNMTEKDVRVLSAAQIGVISELASLEGAPTRRRKKEAVLERKKQLFRDTFKTVDITGDSAEEFLGTIPKDYPSHKARLVLIELVMANPFAPYELKFKAHDKRNALESVVPYLGLSPEDIVSTEKSVKEARAAHTKLAWGKILVIGTVGTVVLAAGGWILAPVIGGALGAGASLSGAAAVSHGLAILGGGPIAAGGAGMAGGTWLVTGVGAAAGATVGGGGSLLYNLGRHTMAQEVWKLQVTFKEVLLRQDQDVLKAQNVIIELRNRQKELEESLAEEQKLNEARSHHIKELKEMIKFVKQSIEWMEKEQAAAARA